MGVFTSNDVRDAAGWFHAWFWLEVCVPFALVALLAAGLIGFESAGPAGLAAVAATGYVLLGATALARVACASRVAGNPFMRLLGREKPATVARWAGRVAVVFLLLGPPMAVTLYGLATGSPLLQAVGVALLVPALLLHYLCARSLRQALLACYNRLRLLDSEEILPAARHDRVNQDGPLERCAYQHTASRSSAPTRMPPGSLARARLALPTSICRQANLSAEAPGSTPWSHTLTSGCSSPHRFQAVTSPLQRTRSAAHTALRPLYSCPTRASGVRNHHTCSVNHGRPRSQRS